MSGEVARLGLEVTSGPVTAASAELDKFTAASGKAEAAAKGLKAGSYTAANAARQLTVVTQLETHALDAQTAAAKRSASAIQAQAAVVRTMTMQSRQLMYQLVDVGQALATAPTMGIYALQNLGFQFAQIGQMYAGNGGLKAALTDSIAMVGRFAAKIGPVGLAVGAVAGTFAGLTYEINKTTDASVGFGDVIQATLIVARDAIYDTLKPAIDAISPWVSEAWDGIVSGFAYGINDVVGHIVGAFEFIKEAGLQLPSAFGDIAFRIADNFYQGISQMVRDTITDINSMIGRINYALSDTGVQLKTMDNTFGLGPDHLQKHISNPYAGAADKAIGAFNEGMGRDYAGQWFDSIRDKAVELAQASKDAGKAIKDAASDAIDPWEGLRKVSDGVKEEMRNLQRQAKMTADAWNRFGEGGVDILTGLAMGTMSWKDALQQAIPLVEQLIMNLIKAQQIGGGGVGGWLSWLFGGGGGGGIAGALSVVAGGGYSGLYAKGGAFEGGNVIPFAQGGIVSRPTMFPMANGAGLMGEAGPEGILPLRRNSQGQLGVMAGGGAANQNVASPMQFTYAPSYNVSGTTEDIDRLKQQMAKDRHEFEAKTVAAVRKAQKTRAL